MPVFEFLGQIRDQSVSVVLCRDKRRAWYHRGIRDVGDGIDDVASLLDGLRARSQAERVVTVGTSAGGYAALLFGCLLEADAAVAFAPQTFISPQARRHYGETRWGKHTRSLIARGALDERYADLAPVLADGGSGTKYEIHHSHARDAVHAGYLATTVDVEDHDHGRGHHNTAALLRDRGTLGPVLTEAVVGPR
jgi:acetyl esterase/lipase